MYRFLLQSVIYIADVLHAVEEPSINGCQLVNLLYVKISVVHAACQSEHALVSRELEILIKSVITKRDHKYLQDSCQREHTSATGCRVNV